MEKTVSIEHMSNEILALIFRFLDWKSFLRANFVCKAWSHFHKEDYLWKHMYYRDIIDLPESGPLPNLPFATLFKKCALYRSWKLVHTHKTHDEAWQVSVSPNGQYIASSDKAGALKIWKLKIQQDPTPTVMIEDEFTRTYLDSITRHEWSPNSDHIIATLSDDSAVGLLFKDWSDSITTRVALFDCYAGFLNNEQMLHSLHFMRKQGGKMEMVMQLLDVATNTQVWKSYVQSSPNSLHFTILSPKKTYLASATAGAEAADVDLLDELWLIETEQLRKKAVVRKPPKVEVDEFGEEFYLSDEEVVTSSVTTRDECKIIQESGHIIGFCFSKDEEQLFVNVRNFSDPSNSSIVEEIETHVWDLKTMTKLSSWVTGRCEEVFIVHPSLALLDQIVCTGSGDGNLTILHKHSQTILHQFKAHEKLINLAVLHPEVDLLVTASDSSEVKFWVPTNSDLDVKFI